MTIKYLHISFFCVANMKISITFANVTKKYDEQLNYEFVISNFNSQYHEEINNSAFFVLYI